METSQVPVATPTDMVIQFIPLTVLSLIYAVVIFAVARKRGINPWPWTIGTLVPIVGMIIIGPLFLLLSFLSVLDRLKVLEEQGSF